MRITIEEIERWANSSQMDERFSQWAEEFQDFDDYILNVCDYESLLRFASNRKSPRRQFFALGLIERLVRELYAHHGLPYEFSRFSGLAPFDEYMARECQRIKTVYDACTVVEKMRTSPQEEVKNIGNTILDYRHDRNFSDANITKLLQLLNYQVGLSFRPGVTLYTMRLCRNCEDGFKSWIDSGVEIESAICPFCVLKIQYPQKTGKKAKPLTGLDS